MKILDLNTRNLKPETIIDKPYIKYGVLSTLAFALCFLLMKPINYLELQELPVLYTLFLAVGIVLALTEYCGINSEEKIEYFTGLKLGFYTSLVASGLLSLLIMGYLSVDISFMNQINETAPFYLSLNPITVSGAMLFEGLSSGAIITFIAMQYFKKCY